MEMNEEMNPAIKRVNYHTHTNYCKHAAGTAAEYAAQARRRKVEILGFSDHLPFPGNPYGYRMDMEDLEAYCRDVGKERERYQGQMEVLCGFEGEYVEGQEDYYEWLYKENFCQYMLLGQHWFADGKGQVWQTGGVPSTEYYPLYVDWLLKGMRTGFFRAIAHPDLIFMNSYAWDKYCEIACDRLLEGCTAHNYLLEFNANGYRRGICRFEDGERFQYPHRKLWEKIARTSLPVIIGSDCHHPKQVYDETVLDAYREAEEMGLCLVTELF